MSVHDPKDLLDATTTIVTALIAANRLPDAEAGIPAIYAALAATVASAPAATDTGERATPEPAVSVRKSLASPDHIISMIDGKPYKTLRRHLTTHGYTPESYREAFGLKADYPMVAETYSESRRAMAKKIGLGRKPRA